MDKVLRNKLLGLCQTTPDKIQVVVENPNKVFVASFLPKLHLGDDIEGMVDCFWDAKEAEERARGNTNFFNGGQCELVRFDVFKSGYVGAHLLQTDYKHAVASKKANIGPELWLIGNSGAIVFRGSTGERNYVFGERGRNVQNVGGVLELPPAGYIDTGNSRIIPHNLSSQCGSNGYPVFDANILDEREEELGFPFEFPADLPSAKTVGVQAVGVIQIVPYHDYNVSHVIEMNTSSEEVREMFEHRLKKNELDAIHIVPESGLLKFMQEQGQTLGYRAKSHFEHMIKYASIVNTD
ncbi:MAG: hypothetical protein Q7R96_02355 [Nanoarchaeota archaeon]|nr:hypothetical protein [Nanoarchaeota archaeon]